MKVNDMGMTAKERRKYASKVEKIASGSFELITEKSPLSLVKDVLEHWAFRYYDVPELIHRLSRKVRNQSIPHIPLRFWRTAEKDVFELFDWTTVRLLGIFSNGAVSPTLPSKLFRLLTAEARGNAKAKLMWENVSTAVGRSALECAVSLESEEDPTFVRQVLAEFTGRWSVLFEQDLPSDFTKVPDWLWEVVPASEHIGVISYAKLSYSKWPTSLQTMQGVRHLLEWCVAEAENSASKVVAKMSDFQDIPFKFLTKKQLGKLLSWFENSARLEAAYQEEDLVFDHWVQNLYKVTWPDVLCWVWKFTPEAILEDKKWWDAQEFSFKAIFVPELYPQEFQAFLPDLPDLSEDIVWYSNEVKNQPRMLKLFRSMALYEIQNQHRDLSCSLVQQCEEAEMGGCGWQYLDEDILIDSDMWSNFRTAWERCGAMRSAGSLATFNKGANLLAKAIGVRSGFVESLQDPQRAVYFPCLTLAVFDAKISGCSWAEAFEARLMAIRGWRDACTYMSRGMSWRVFEARQRGEEVTYEMLAKGGMLGSEELEFNPWQKFPYATYQKLLAYAGYAGRKRLTPNQAKPAANIALIFGSDSDAALRFIQQNSKSKQTWRQVHDVGVSFTLPADFVPDKDFADFCLKHKGAAKHAEAFLLAKKKGIVFKSLEACRRYGREVLLGDVPPEYAYLRAFCADNDVESCRMRQTIDMAKNAKKKAYLPEVNLTSHEGDHLSLLPIGDLRALLIGEESGCCQALGGVGEDAATHSFVMPDSGVYTFRSPAGTLLAQSWVWMSEDRKGLVFDSIESRFDDKGTVKRVAELLLMFVQHAKTLGMNVYIGDTGYGMTKDVQKALGRLEEVEEIAEVETPTSMSTLDYSDAEDGCYLVVLK